MRGAEGDEAISYVYDGDQVICEYDASDVIQAKYVYGPGIDEPILMEDVITGDIYYYHFDGLGSVIALSDSDGDLTESYSYDIFGAVTSSLSSVGNPYYFTGRRYDEETGLYYYRARYYDPFIGRFGSTDPIRSQFISGNNEPSWLTPLLLSIPNVSHPYTYANNNPANYIDPEGKIAASTILIILAALAAGKLVYKFYQCARWAGKAMDKAREIRRKLEKESECGIVSEDEVAGELMKTKEWKKTLSYCGSAALESYTTP